MTHSEIEAFLVLVREKSFTKAAAQLYIGQPSLSSKIKTLEKELGVKLITHRQGQKILELTHEGEEFYKIALEYMDVYERLINFKSPYSNTKLRVAAINSISTYLFLPVYERFMKKYPEVELVIQDMETAAATQNIDEGKTDMAFTTKAADPMIVSSAPAFAEKIEFVCSKDSDYPDLITRDMLKVNREIVINWGGELEKWHNNIFGTNAKPKVKCELIEQLKYFLHDKNSWALVPACIARQLVLLGDFRVCDTEFSIPMRVTNCLNAVGKTRSNVMNNFILCMNEVIRENWGKDEILLYPLIK